MIVYSQKIITFVKEIKSTIQKVLTYEIGLKVGRDRFMNRQETGSYPIKVDVYNNKTMLGYFDPNFYEMGFHECLMQSSKAQLDNIIRHELAHYMIFIEHGPYVQAHGSQFRDFCRSMRWAEDVYRATTCLDDGNHVSILTENSVLRKVQKLMALSTSANQHESEQAMIKAQQMLLKHNVEARDIDNSDDDKIFLKRILKQSKENAKMRAIAQILETFFVNTVYNRGGDYIYLEIMGNRVNIEIAEYVAEILQQEMERLWLTAQLQYADLKGIVAKNSFFLGIARGYCDKIKALKREYSSETCQALMVIEKQLVDATAMAYKRLSKSKSSGSHDAGAAMLGQEAGKQLNINPALKQAAKHSIALIGTVA